ncbi:hypothetical protein FRY74_12760, partial [Vicingus serpentipes]
PSEILITTSTVTATCGMPNGEAHASISGGTPGYSYFWNPGMVNDTSMLGLNSGSYTFYVTDNNGCNDSAIVNVSSAIGPTALIDTITNVSCFGGNNGSITGIANGGTPPLTIDWISTGTTDLIDSNLTAGIYVFSVTDDNGCQDFATAEIQEPDSLIAALLGADVNCNGGSDGSIEAFVSGGTTPYSYLWSGNLDTGNISDSLLAGIYNVVISDINNCQLTSSITIGEPTPLFLSLIGTNVNCYEGNDGSAIANVTGGTPNYNYSWTPALGSSDALTGIQAGTYNLTVEDGNNCFISDSIIITQPASGLSLDIAQTNVSCNGGNDGELIVTPNGGTAPFSFAWS